MTTAAPRPNAGLLGGRYQLLKHLASGGMAEVHLARATGIGGFARHVVVKRILPEHARDARFVTMFLDEARLAAQLHHQNVVQVYDIGEDDGSYFFAMEYVHGVDLREVLRAVARQRGQLPIEHALAIVAGAAAGLHHAHDRLGPDRQPLGLVHRDVSLSNILLAYDGAVKVVDFGIAKAATRTTETGSGTLKGKVTYMSPEQCQGKPLDRRSDVFALGIVLYELTTVTRLFSADNDYATMHQIVAQDVPPPSSRRADYPPGLEPIVLRALARDVDARYASAGALLEAIEGYAAMRGLTMSPAALGRWVRDLLGERPEPWHDLGSATGPPVVVSLLEGSLPEVIVAQTESSLSAISGVRLPGSPAVAAEVADVAAVQAASAVAAPAAPVAAAAPRRARWPWIVALGLASAAAGGAIARCSGAAPPRIPRGRSRRIPRARSRQPARRRWTTRARSRPWSRLPTRRRGTRATSRPRPWPRARRPTAPTAPTAPTTPT